jgi:hypothetical protein
MTRWLQVILFSLLAGAAFGLEPPKTGLILHLDAASITGVANNGLLTGGWADQSSSGVIATSSSPPKYILDAGGGYPSVWFDGTGQFLQANVATGGDASVFVVFANRRSGLTTIAYQEPLLVSSGTNPGLWLATSRLTSISANSVIPDYLSFSALPASGVTAQTWLDGRDTASVGGDIVNGRFYIGSAVYRNLPAASSLFIGGSDATGTKTSKNDIRELLVYNRALSDDERGAVQRYLGAKYDIATVWRPLAQSVEARPHVLGSQQFGNQYSFGETNGVRVLDYARAIMKQGNRVIKFRLSQKYNSEDGFSAVANTTGWRLINLVRDHPEVKQVLDLPLTDYLFWMAEFSFPNWQNQLDTVGLKPTVQTAIYNEVYNLVVYLRTTYSGTGKRFYLGNWEGDNMLNGTATVSGDPTTIPANAIQGMIDWATIRQKAVDDAKAATPNSDLQVWYYLEMNRADWMRNNQPCVANSVIPQLSKLDMISISSYTVHKDTNGDLAPTSRIYSDLNRVKALIDAKPDATIPGSRIIIGEYGYVWNATKYGNSLLNYAQVHFDTAEAYFGWPGGTLRFILQWQFYNKTDADGTDVSKMCQIDWQKNYTPLYYGHENFFRRMRRWVDDYQMRTGTMPSDRAYADQAYYVLSTLSLTRYAPTVTFTSYNAWKSYHFVDAAEFSNAAISGPTADPYGTGSANLLRYGLSLGKFGENIERMPYAQLDSGIINFRTPFDAKKTDLRWIIQATSSLSQWNLTLFDSATNTASPVNGWIQYNANGQITPGAPVFYRLQLQTIP